MNRNDRLGGLVAMPLSWHRAGTWLVRFDPVGWVVAAHALSLAAVSTVASPVGVVSAALALPIWRTGLRSMLPRVAVGRREGLLLVRGAGSLILAGWMVGLDGGTESPLFFSMLMVVVWEAVTGPTRRFLRLAVVAVAVYLVVIVEALDVTAASVIRLGVFGGFLGLLLWGRGLSEHWQRESERAKALAAGITEGSPIGLAVYDPDTVRCLFANAIAQTFGLDDPEGASLIRVESSPESQLVDDLAFVARSHHSQPPMLYAMVRADNPVFFRIGISFQQIGNVRHVLVLHAEDVTAQVAVGEQHRRFLESANHQFRTPLSPIRAYAELIAQGELEVDELHEAAEAIRSGALRIERLLDRISSLLRVQREANRAGVLVPVGVILDHLLDEHPDLRAVITVEGDVNVPVRCDPKPIETALAELVENSREHGVPPITIVIEPRLTEACLRLSDNGPGPDLDPDIDLGEPWSPIARVEVMPPEMGSRLGITYAHALTAAGGGSLRFQRDQNSWAYLLHLPSLSGAGFPAPRPSPNVIV